MKFESVVMTVVMAVPMLAANVVAAADSLTGVTDVHLTGPYGRILDSMIENHLERTDATYLASVFRYKVETCRWQTEFWGKYMHAAVPFMVYTGSEKLRANIAKSVEELIATQDPDGYIGNYTEEARLGPQWDVWGTKYTMMGLLHWYDATKDEKAINAAKRLCDYLIAEIGPNAKRKPIWYTGQWCGMPSSSVLEPVMWLYNRTKEQRYLDFATFIVKGMSEVEDGPRLIDLALKGIHVADRNGYGNKAYKDGGYSSRTNRQKAYEMLSCYQGLIEYYEVTGREALLKAAIASVDDVLAEEINLAGGAASSELWYHGAKQQHLQYLKLQETCVTTTWMRILEKLLKMTKNPKYADALERTFYNAYLAALRPGEREFAAYTPLNGSRNHCHDHCCMHTDCCNANGPRGYLSFLKSMIDGGENRVVINFYVSGTMKASLGKNGKVAEFETYALYPRIGSVHLVNRTAGDHTIALRIPAFSEKTVLKINGENYAGKIAAGKYLELKRDWKVGDIIDIGFDMKVQCYEQDSYVAFTYGPILLARDSRFNDGPIDEVFCTTEWGLGEHTAVAVPELKVIRATSDDIRMEFAACLKMGQHTQNPEGKYPVLVKFCDYASAGNRWRTDNYYRTWFPVEH